MVKKHKNTKYIGFEEFEIRCKELANEISTNKNIKKIYGVPRGGVIPAMRIALLTDLKWTNNPNAKDTAIIDDCIDSGATRHSFSNFPYFFPLIDKQYENIKEWIAFWWREK